MRALTESRVRRVRARARVQLIDFLMKHLAAQLVPMYDKQARKFSAGGALQHLVEAGEEAPTYVELRRRLAVLQGGGGG